MCHLIIRIRRLGITLETSDHGCAGETSWHVWGFLQALCTINLEIVGVLISVVTRYLDIFPRSIVSAFCRSLEVDLHDHFIYSRFLLLLSILLP